MLSRLAADAGRPEPDDEAMAILPANGSLVRALDRATAAAVNGDADGGLPLVAELKRSSPSAGPLLASDLRAYLGAVRRGGACALSVVTAGGAFSGRPRLLREAHPEGLPLLMKDFITSAAQLDLAVRHGASAILLIERLLGVSRREGLVREAHLRGLEVLLEVNGPAEAEAVDASRADLVGVNSRDLETLRIDLDGALDVVQGLARRRPTLLLSGVLTPTHAERARAAGAAGVLVGSALLGAVDPATTARALRRSIVKVCGNRTSDDVAHAAGADLVGVVVGADSPRDVPFPVAHDLLRQAERQGAASVAVTRGQDRLGLVKLASGLRPTFLQVHGPLDDATVAQVHALGVGLLHAITPGSSAQEGCDGTVLDSTPRGGSGTAHEGQVPLGPGLHLVAGGLDAGTVRQAVLRSGAAGADASSRLETAGAKDPRKVAAFIAAGRQAVRRPHGA